MKRFRWIIEALQVHYTLFGDYEVPINFILPSEEPWPRIAWGLNLGTRIRDIKQMKCFKEDYYREELERIGFPFK